MKIAGDSTAPTTANPLPQPAITQRAVAVSRNTAHSVSIRRRETARNVPTIRTQEAAALTGKSRTTIWRAIKSGRVSAARADSGDFEIDLAELERVFGLPGSPDAASSRDTLRIVPLKPPATSNETMELRVELATMRERAAALERENAMLRDDREQARQERDRLLRIIEEQSGQLRLLTDQRQNALTPLPWWRRFRRRSHT